MKRTRLLYLSQWLARLDRKPLLLRGARQVGKSYLVRELAKLEGLELLEMNLEQKPELAEIVLIQNLEQRRLLLEAQFKTRLQDRKPLLFLDELQAAPQLIPQLRYLHEQDPELPVICAGSLLDFALSEQDASMPVGRIESMYLGPMSFEEFLLATGEEIWVSWLQQFQWGDPCPESIHQGLLTRLKQYCWVGGMPEAVRAFSEGMGLESVDRIQKSLLLTYQDDFNKYRRRVPSERLRKLFRALPSRVGKKLVYSQIDGDETSAQLGQALDLLCHARVAYRVLHSSANGVPLGAESNPKYIKPLFLDVGLMSSQLGLPLTELALEPDLIQINQGAVAEQFIGQHLLYDSAPYQEPELYCWAREKANAMAEVDYLITSGTRVIPVEVKSGKSAKLKSLWIFLSEKKRDLGLRLCSEKPSIEPQQNAALLTLPLYMIGQVRRLLESLPK